MTPENKKPRWLTANQNYYPKLMDDRKRLKNNMTVAEKLLWEKLKSKKLGAKFRRQHVIDCFIVDFVCLSVKLVIEVDGKIHLKQKDYDNMRSERLNLLGFKVLRLSNETVENNIDSALRKIKSTIYEISPKNISPPSGDLGGEK